MRFVHCITHSWSRSGPEHEKQGSEHDVPDNIIEYEKWNFEHACQKMMSEHD